MFVKNSIHYQLQYQVTQHTSHWEEGYRISNPLKEDDIYLDWPLKYYYLANRKALESHLPL